MTDGNKYDGDKLRFDLIPSHPLELLAAVYTMGAKKYDDRNWEKGIAWGRIFGAVQRHLWAFWRGEDKDPESGLPHLAHAAWGCFTLLEYMSTHREKDDRSDLYKLELEEGMRLFHKCLDDIKNELIHENHAPGFSISPPRYSVFK